MCACFCLKEPGWIVHRLIPHAALVVPVLTYTGA
jgi:hypothetical protein